MFHLFLATPEKVLIDQEIYSLKAPASFGYLEVLSHHAPLIALLKSGVVTVKFSEEESSFFAIQAGFLKVSMNQAILLADSAEKLLK